MYVCVHVCVCDRVCVPLCSLPCSAAPPRRMLLRQTAARRRFGSGGRGAPTRSSAMGAGRRVGAVQSGPSPSTDNKGRRATREPPCCRRGGEGESDRLKRSPPGALLLCWGRCSRGALHPELLMATAARGLRRSPKASLRPFRRTRAHRDRLMPRSLQQSCLGLQGGPVPE